MTLADSADRRVARHPPDVAAAKGRQRHARSAPGGGRCRFNPGVTGTNDEDVKHPRGLAARDVKIKNSVFPVKLFAETEASEQGVEQGFDP